MCLNRINIYVIYKLRYWPSWSPFCFLYLGALFSQYQDIQKISIPDFLKSCYPIFLLHTYSLLALCSSPLLVGGCVSGWSANLPNCLLIFHISTMFSSPISIFTDVWIFTTVMIQNRIQRCYGSNGVLWPWPSSYPSGSFQLDFVTVVLISRDRVFIINIKGSVSCKQK